MTDKPLTLTDEDLTEAEEAAHAALARLPEGCRTRRWYTHGCVDGQGAQLYREVLAPGWEVRLGGSAPREEDVIVIRTEGESVDEDTIRHIARADPVTVLALVAEVRRLRTLLPRQAPQWRGYWTDPGVEEVRFIATLEEARAFATQSENHVRRPMEPQPIPCKGGWDWLRQDDSQQFSGVANTEKEASAAWGPHCPLGRPGQHLWVAEGYASDYAEGKGFVPHYEADGQPHPRAGRPGLDTWAKADGMPRWAARSVVMVTSVRVDLRDGTWEWVLSWRKR